MPAGRTGAPVWHAPDVPGGVRPPYFLPGTSAIHVVTGSQVIGISGDYSLPERRCLSTMGLSLEILPRVIRKV